MSETETPITGKLSKLTHFQVGFLIDRNLIEHKVDSLVSNLFSDVTSETEKPDSWDIM